MKHLFIQTDEYYLFLDESGTPEINDLSEDCFVLSCVKVEKSYYDIIFRKEILKFKKKHKIPTLVLHSSDIRKHRKGFEFLKGALNISVRERFFDSLSELVDGLDFEVFYFSVYKKDCLEPDFDIYWHSLREVLRMINNNLSNTNNVLSIFCESRNPDQNRSLSNAYNAYFQELKSQHKFRVCFPSKLEFRNKNFELYEISGLEIVDLMSFPILNFIRAKLQKTAINPNLLNNYKIVKSKVVKNYHFNLHKNKNLPVGAVRLT